MDEASLKPLPLLSRRRSQAGAAKGWSDINVQGGYMIRKLLKTSVCGQSVGSGSGSKGGGREVGRGGKKANASHRTQKEKTRLRETRDPHAGTHITHVQGIKGR